jgi:hypothetical protein
LFAFVSEEWWQSRKAMRTSVGRTEIALKDFVHARAAKRAIKAQRGGVSQGGATVFTSGIGPRAIGQEWRNLSAAAVAVLRGVVRI